MVNNMIQQSEFYVKLHKWADNIDGILTEWAEEAIAEHYGVEDPLELSAEQIEELEAWVELNSDIGYDYTLIGFRNIINYWENENYDND